MTFNEKVKTQRRKWQPTPVFLPGESQGWGSLEGCRLWESDTTEATQHQQRRIGMCIDQECITILFQAVRFQEQCLQTVLVLELRSLMSTTPHHLMLYGKYKKAIKCVTALSKHSQQRPQMYIMQSTSFIMQTFSNHLLIMVLLYNYAFPINLSPSSGYKFLMPIGITRSVFYLIHKHFYLIFVLILIAASQSFVSDSSISFPLCLFRVSPRKHTIGEGC